MFQPYRGRLALAFLGMILTAATEPMFPAVMRVLLDLMILWMFLIHIRSYYHYN